MQAGLDQIGPEAEGEGVAPTYNTIFTKIITQTKRAGLHSLTHSTAQHPGPSLCLQVGRSELGWAEAGVHPKGGDTGQEAEGSGTGRGQPRTSAQGKVWGPQRPCGAQQASGDLT